MTTFSLGRNKPQGLDKMTNVKVSAFKHPYVSCCLPLLCMYLHTYIYVGMCAYESVYAIIVGIIKNNNIRFTDLTHISLYVVVLLLTAFVVMYLLCLYWCLAWLFSYLTGWSYWQKIKNWKRKRKTNNFALNALEKVLVHQETLNM